MLTPLLAVLVLILAEAPAPAALAAPVAAPPAVAPKPDPVKAEINSILEPYRGKSGDRLRGKLGFSIGKRPASDGEVVFWMVNIEQDTVCGVDPSNGAMRCIRPDPFQCRLAIAFDPAGIVKAWAVTGEPDVCRGFITLLKAP
jgi:hypothetical protein